MFINKIGMEHLESGTNCQDYGFEGEWLSIVCDGCSEGKHSEVGAKLFCQLYKDYGDAKDIFNELSGLFYQEVKQLKDFLCFTILRLCKDNKKYFEVSYCGNGYIILQDHDGNITFEELSDGEYPKYYICNYIPPECLKHYKDGVSFSRKTYSKEEYAKVGIASDGLRYILQADEELKQEFINCLKSGKELKNKVIYQSKSRDF